MPEAPEIRFLPFEGRRIAYTVSGEGPPLVAAAWWLSHLELDARDPAIRAFWEQVAAGFTLVRYDRLGVGMSDRELPEAGPTLDGEVALLKALLDGLGLGRVALLGGSSGASAAVAFAARHPERVERLVLYGGAADGARVGPPEARDAILTTVRSHWGLGSRVLADVFLGPSSSAEQRRFARYQRAAADAGTAAELLGLVYRTDVRAELARVRAPARVVHRRSDRAIPYALGRELAAAIPGATLVPLEGSAHFPWNGDAASVVRAVRGFLLPDASATTDGEPPPPTSAGASHEDLLTAREREVLALVARGLSDAEIAEQLVLSPHTVHRHVANIRGKLGRGSRAAAVAEAARLGLL